VEVDFSATSIVNSVVNSTCRSVVGVVSDISTVVSLKLIFGVDVIFDAKVMLATFVIVVAMV
jgi:hypothetical protein